MKQKDLIDVIDLFDDSATISKFSVRAMHYRKLKVYGNENKSFIIVYALVDVSVGSLFEEILVFLFQSVATMGINDRCAVGACNNARKWLKNQSAN